MGLLDSIAGEILSKTMGDKGAMAQIALEMMNRHGGLEGVLDKFSQGGLGDLAASWIGLGENQPVQPTQINDVFGNSELAELAEKFGLPVDILSSQVAENLPNFVDKVTPEGQLDSKSGDLLSTILVSMMK